LVKTCNWNFLGLFLLSFVCSMLHHAPPPLAVSGLLGRRRV
jgi:hypothetical protein